MSLNSGQQTAVTSIFTFLSDKSRWAFVLKGPAGTGKTFCMREVVAQHKSRVLFTAPTNKAVKVLQETLTSPDYRPECRTIYSALGLKLMADGEVKELAQPEDPLDLTKFSLIVVDEASMLNSPLLTYIKQVAALQHLKFLFMGDPYQLPPVGESSSPVWGMPCDAELSEIMRFDNQIVGLAASLRKALDTAIPRCFLKSDHADGEGVWVMGQPAFQSRILQEASAGGFSVPNGAKAIAWRNITVHTLNRLIRGQIFDNAKEQFWLPTDRITLLEPAKDLEGVTIATTDDEGVVERVEVTYHPVYKTFKVWRLLVQFDDNKLGTVFSLHPDSQADFNWEKESLAKVARLEKRKWKDFWAFCESFHSIRHGYACTAHRAQGSTYERVFVDYRDILANRNRQEAFQCLYVACTRPKKELYLA